MEENKEYAAPDVIFATPRLGLCYPYPEHKDEEEKPQENRWQQMLNYGNADDLYNKVSTWNDFPEFSSHIGKAERGATDYLKNRLSIDHTLNSSTVGAYYRNDFFPKFFSYQLFKNICQYNHPSSLLFIPYLLYLL